MRTIFILLILSLSAAYSFGQQSTIQQAPTKAMSALQEEKLRLEIKELRAKTKQPRPKALFALLAFLNQSIVGTILTLSVGSFAFAILSERRARNSKQLDKAVEFIDGVAADLNAVFTPMFIYIREGNWENIPNSRANKKPIIVALRKKVSQWLARQLRVKIMSEDDARPDTERILDTLKEKVPKLFEKRLSVKAKTEAFLPQKSQSFESHYVDLCQELEQVLKKLQKVESSKHPETYTEQIKARKEKIAHAWSITLKDFRRPTNQHLKPPFNELDEWIEIAWYRCNILLGSTLKDILKSNTSPRSPSSNPGDIPGPRPSSKPAKQPQPQLQDDASRCSSEMAGPEVQTPAILLPDHGESVPARLDRLRL